MKYLQRFTLFTILWSASFATLPLAAQSDRPEESRLESPFDPLPGPEPASDLDRSILEQMKSSRIPGLAAAIVKEGRPVWSGSYGWANIEQQQPVTDQTYFQVASISKTITASVVMQLVEQGKLSLDVDVDTILPYSVRNPRHPESPITLRQLLTHTAGIKDNWDVLEGFWVKNGDFPEPLLPSLGDYFQSTGKYYNRKKNYYDWAPGTRQKYSNVGFALVAGVAELVAGVPFEQLCEESLLQPLGIEGSRFRLAGMDRSKIAMPYQWKKKRGEMKPLGHHGYLDWPSGTLKISAPQLARFLACFINDGQLDDVRVLSQDSVQEMRKIAFPKIAPKQGLAWYFSKTAGQAVLGHDGGDPGVLTFMGYRPEDGVGVILLMNTEPKNDRFESSLIRLLFQYADQLPPTRPEERSSEDQGS
ncbi:MAG: beta-lactamase family protein [Mariniblastus sp.]|nr:beta-lactamase family protein [Mariniblastus sp.]